MSRLGRRRLESLIENAPWPRFTGRAASVRYPEDTNALAGRRVLITGAAGFIGSALSTAVAGSGCSGLLLLDQSQPALPDRSRHPAVSQATPFIQAIQGDIRDAALLDNLFETFRPNIVFHAAALKYVPQAEQDPLTTTSVNAFGTQTLLRACERAGVERFVHLSTDKAVDPISVLGLTKRIAERIALSAAHSGSLRVTALRLGNVLGSTGSIVPLLLAQLASEQPLTLTHPDARRYFLSPAEAVQHLLHASTLNRDDLLVVPAMGEQRRILDLANFLVEHCARTTPPPAIRYTGLRPGDKLEERLWSVTETVSRLDGHLFAIENAAADEPPLAAALLDLARAISARDLPAWFEASRRIVPEYQPSDLLLQQLESASVERVP